MQLPAAVNLWY